MKKQLLFAGSFLFVFCQAIAAPSDIFHIDIDNNWQAKEGNVIETLNRKNITHNTEWQGKGLQGAKQGKATLAKGKAETLIYEAKGMDAGTYTLTAQISSTGNAGTAFLFGKGSGYTTASTMIPGGENQKITVDGIRSNGDKLIIGLYSDGSETLSISEVELSPSARGKDYLQGGDITMLNYVLDNGGKYYDQSGNLLTHETNSREENAKNVLAFLKESGMNFVRIRLTNNPGQQDNSGTYYLEPGYQDEADCINLATMAHEAGMEIQFTFNLSDFWSNGVQQDVPQDWRKILNSTAKGKETEALSKCIHDHISHVMQSLASRGIFPAYVSIGNETNGGFLFPYGYTYDVSRADATLAMPAGSSNWTAIAQWINTGYDAIKEISPQSQVVIHLADNTSDVIDANKRNKTDWWVYAWYFDNLEKAGARYDVIGASYYPSVCGATASEAADYYRALMERYGKDILVMETGYSFAPKRKDGYDGQLPHTAPEYEQRFPFTADGQKGFIADVINNQRSTFCGKNHIVGDLYWDPLMIHVEDKYGQNKTGWANLVSTQKADVNVVENTTLFDFQGKALPALDAYTHNRSAEALTPHTVHIENYGAEFENEHNGTQLFHGDSLNIVLKKDGYQADSVMAKTKGKATTLFPEDTLRMEMPDGDLEIAIHWSQAKTAHAEQTQTSALRIATSKDGITVTADRNRTITVYDTNGHIIRTKNLKANQREKISLKNGVYIISGKTVSVR